MKKAAESQAADAEKFAREHPELALWKNIKTQLTGADGDNYFNTGMKGAKLPTLKGRVVKLEPENRPKTVVLALEDGTTADATLKFEAALPGKVDAGTELTFEGVPESYSTSPFMVVFNMSIQQTCTAGRARTRRRCAGRHPRKALRKSRRLLYARPEDRPSPGRSQRRAELATCWSEAACSNPLPTKKARSSRQTSAANPCSVARPGAPMLPKPLSRRSMKATNPSRSTMRCEVDLGRNNVNAGGGQALQLSAHIL